MGSTLPGTLRSADREASAESVLQWRSWPLAEHKRWSWLVVLGVLATGGICAYISENWLPGLLAAMGLSAALWQFFVPVAFEMDSLGIRRSALGRTRHVPWQAVRAYQLRSTGVLLFQRLDPMPIDLLRSIFIPYPSDEDEILCAVRDHLSHALELPT